MLEHEHSRPAIRLDDRATPARHARGTLAARTQEVFEVTGGRGRASWQSLREFWAFRGVLEAFARRQVKVKYKQAFVGIGWVVLQPLLAALIFAIFFGRYAHLSSDGSPYLLFALAGMVCWTCFSNASSSAIDSLVQDQMLLRKVYFPREVLPLSSVVATLVDFVPGVLTVAVVAALYGIAPSVSIAALPVLILLLWLSAAAFGLALSGINVYYRDVRYALPFVLQLGLFVSPVAYSLSQIPASWRDAYAILNPVAAAIDGFRQIFVHQTWPRWDITCGALLWTFTLLALSYDFFKRLERGFSDRI